jgi:thymidylate kinase
MKSQYILIAGPQASGKSSVIRYISNKFQCLATMDRNKYKYISNNIGNKMPANLVILQEMRQIVSQEHFVPGGRFVDCIIESEIIERDIIRLKRILEEADNRIYVDETCLFTLAHAIFHNINIEVILPEYLNILRQFNTLLIFLDINKDTSWARRKHRYEQRVCDFPYKEKVKALEEYRAYLDRVYNNLYKMYDDYEFPKVKISTERPIEDALEDVANIIKEEAVKYDMDIISRI